jgi:hypothetical protein
MHRAFGVGVSLCALVWAGSASAQDASRGNPPLTALTSPACDLFNVTPSVQTKSDDNGAARLRSPRASLMGTRE